MQFSCANLPANTACVFAPGSVTLAGTAEATTVLTVVLNTGIKPSALPLGGVAFAALFAFTFRRRRRLAPLCLLAGLAALSGCGGGYSSGASSPGVYQVNVLATSGAITQTATLTLTIQ